VQGYGIKLITEFAKNEWLSGIKDVLTVPSHYI